MWSARFRRVITAHPHLVDVGWAAVVLLPLVPDALIQSGRPGAPAALLTAAPLLLRRRAPLAMLLITAALAVPAWAVLGGRPAFPVVLVLLGVLSLAIERRRWPVYVGISAAVVVFGVLALTDAVARDPHLPPTSVWAAPMVTGPLLAAAVLLGTTLRARREQVRLLEERAQRLQSERDQQAQIAVAAERARIAGELHDVVAHALTVVVRLGDAMAVRASRNPAAPADPAALDAVTATARQALAEVRRLVEVVGEEPSLVPLPGTADGTAPTATDDLDAVVAGVRAAGVPVRLTRHGPQDGWSRVTRLAVHRIVTQALSNVLEHAGLGARAEVLVRCDGRHVEVEVVDDGVGVGVDPARRGDRQGRGRGIPGMRERATVYGGTFSAGPAPGGGWRVRAVVPVQQGGEP